MHLVAAPKRDDHRIEFRDSNVQGMKISPAYVIFEREWRNVEGVPAKGQNLDRGYESC
jgi:hypothetical protein